eukprot:jgi/Mesvir1/12852/Mv26281-RA.1
MAAVRKPSGEDEVPLDEDRDTFEFPDFTAGIGETPDRPHFFSSTRRINYGDAAAPADVQLLSAPYVSTANEYDSPPASVASTDRRSGRSKATLAMSQYAEDVLDSRFNYEDVVTEVLVTYQSLSFEVVKMVNGKARTVRILHPASGSILPSTLGAIMGPSGCGKTTFLNMLAGRKLKGTPGGQVLFNGSPIKDVSRQLMSYVKQDDILLGSLTVRETLLFSALLRLPSSMGHKQKVQQVDRVISTLLLDKAANTRVGNEYIRGVSGGEKRRVSVGVDIVVEPSLILLDEPTTGLDSYSALILITVLRKLSFAGRTIVCTIHQPRTDIFEMFDDLILLVDGHLVYKGQTERALDYFAQQGYKCPPRVSPADFLLDTLATRGTGDLLQSNNLRKGSKFGRRMSTRYGTSDAWKMELDTSRQQLSRLSSASGSQLSRQMSNRNYALESRRTGMAAAEEPTNPKKVKPELYAVGMWRQFCLLCWRNTLNLFYNYLEYLVLFIVSLMFGVLLAVIFSGLRDCTSGPDPCSPLPEYKPDCRQQPPCSRSEENDATRSVGFYFFFMLAISNGFGVNAIPAGLEHRAVFHEEHERSMYRILPYWGAQMVVTAIPNALLSFAIVGVSYWFVGSIVLGGQEFLFAVLAVYLSIMCAMAISLTAVYLFIRMKVVLSLVSIALGLEVFFSSNVVTFDLIPGPVRWIFWLNQVQYAFNALMHNQYGTKNQIANDIFDHDKYDNKWIPLIGCGVCFVVLRIFALMAMWLAANQQEIMIQVYHVQSYMLKRAKGVATGVAKGVTAAPMNVIGSARDVASGVAKGVAKGVALMSGSRSDGMNSIMARVLDEQIVADAEDSAARDALGADGDDEVDEEVILRMGKGLKAEKPKEVDEEGKLEAKRKAKKEGGSKTVSYTEDTDHKDGGKGEGGPKDGAGKEVAPADVESKGDGAKDDKHRSTRMRMQSILVRRLHVTWDGLTYEVLKKVKSGGSAMVRVLQPSMGSIPPGTLGAIMGPSGSGKTTFLNILGGRSTGGVAGGSVEVNGKPLGPSTRKYMAYVKQQDFLLAALTVRETLLFSAMLRLPASIGPAERNARVERIIKGLLLQKSRNTLVGNVVIRGLSGGEKRRLSVGVDLVTEPSLILLDEPTSGLDAYSSLVLMAALQRLSQQGRTVLMTIHQPRTDIFEMFTELILLADGRLVYKGPVSASRARGPGVVEYFASLGFVAPPRINTADFLLDVLATPDQFNAFMNMEDVRSVDESQVGGADAGPPTPTGHDKNIIDKLRKCYENSDYYRQNREARVRVFQEQGLLGSPSAAGGADGEEGAGFQGGAPRKEEEAPKYATSLLTETVVLTMRFLLSAARDPEEYRNLFGQVNGSYVPVATPAANLTAEDFYMLRRKLTMGDVVDGMPYELNQEGKWKMLGLLIATFTFYRVVGFLYIHYMSRGAKQVFKEPDLRKLQAEMKKMQRAKTKVARSRVGDTATTASPGNTPKASTPVKGLMARIQWAPVASRKIKQTQSQSQSQSQLSSIGGGGESPPNEREGVVSEAGTDGGGASSGTTAFMAMPVAR